jgi:hypothetical protein
MSHDRIVSLLTSHKVRIARALTRQVRGLSPNYATLDVDALEASFVRFVGYAAHFLMTGDDTSLKNHAVHTAQLRSALGFRVDDFMLATLVFLPVIRQFLLEHSPDLSSGLREYEAFEAVAIPMMSEAATTFRRASADFADIADDDSDEITAPTGKRHRPSGKQATPRNFLLESVTGDATDELTPFR